MASADLDDRITPIIPITLSTPRSEYTEFSEYSDDSDNSDFPDRLKDRFNDFVHNFVCFKW